MKIEKVRWYLHGDLQSQISGTWYCDKCDDFVKVDHFYTECNCENDYARYLRSLKAWQVISKRSSTCFRPSNAVNRFA